MMVTILKSRNLWLLIGLALVVWGLSYLIPRSYLFDVANSLSVAGTFGVIVMYYASVAKKTGSWLWVFYNDLAGPHYFVMGLLGYALYITTRHSYNSVWRWLGKPDWMVDSLVVVYMVFFTAFVAFIQLWSRDLEDGKIPSENWRWIGIISALGIALAGISIAILDPSPPVVGGSLR